MDFRLLNFNQIVNELRKNNPTADIRVGDFVYDSKSQKRIFSSIKADELVLPDGFYLDSNNYISNKSNSTNYFTIEVEPIENINNIINVYPKVDEDVINIDTVDIKLLAVAIKKLNPGVTIKLANRLYYGDTDETIFSDVSIKDLALPSHYYVTNNNKITNKYNSNNCTYISVKVEDINKINPFYLIDINLEEKEDCKVKKLK